MWIISNAKSQEVKNCCIWSFLLWIFWKMFVYLWNLYMWLLSKLSRWSQFILFFHSNIIREIAALPKQNMVEINRAFVRDHRGGKKWIQSTRVGKLGCVPILLRALSSTLLQKLSEYWFLHCKIMKEGHYIDS